MVSNQAEGTSHAQRRSRVLAATPNRFELHMGPRREFALFKGVQDAHRDHDSPENLLKPYRVALDSGRAKQRWEIPSLNVVFTATLAGGSRTDCESWFVVLSPMEKTSH